MMLEITGTTERIDQLFQQARKKTWASIMNDPRVQEVMKEQKEAKRSKSYKNRETRQTFSICTNKWHQQLHIQELVMFQIRVV